MSKELNEGGRPLSIDVTNRKAKEFIDEVLKYKNGVTFQRRIGVHIVRACFRVHRSDNKKCMPVYTLTYADDNNGARCLIDKRIFRDSNLHYVIQDFKRTIEDYLCVLAK